MQSLSLQSFPFSQASLLRTTPLSGVATGDGCEYRQSALVHFRPNLQSVGDCGRSGGTNPARKGVWGAAATIVAEAAAAAGVGFGAMIVGAEEGAVAVGVDAWLAPVEVSAT